MKCTYRPLHGSKGSWKANERVRRHTNSCNREGSGASHEKKRRGEGVGKGVGPVESLRRLGQQVSPLVLVTQLVDVHSEGFRLQQARSSHREHDTLGQQRQQFVEAWGMGCRGGGGWRSPKHS